MKLSTPRGTYDVLPNNQEEWFYVTSVCKDVVHDFSYERIDTPVFESTDLFRRGVGESTDMVQKEMYTFEDHGGDSVTLRPEGTASVCRAYIQHGMYNTPQPVRYYYIAPMFRYERPQSGRLRQHHQFGCEAIGDGSPQIDSEIIELGWSYITRLGLGGITLRINSIGDLTSRARYMKDLKTFLNGFESKLPKIDKERLLRSPLRVLDSKEPETIQIIKKAPRSIDYLQDEPLEHWNELINLLELKKSALRNFDYIIDHTLVRGLDYYNRTVFEFQSTTSGNQGTILGGGRYDPLIELLGGPSTCGVGFGSGIERMILELKKQSVKFQNSLKPDLVIIHIGEASQRSSILATELRNVHVSAILAPKKSIKGQLRYANNIEAKFAIIIGNQELESGVATLKSLNTELKDRTVNLSALNIATLLKKVTI
jgi:histidyl-tRNA synthetase